MLEIVESAIYTLCLITSALCAYLLFRAYRSSRTNLLIWSALCFILLALNNLVVLIDVYVFLELDLTPLRLVTSLLAVGVLLYGFIWET